MRLVVTDAGHQDWRWHCLLFSAIMAAMVVEVRE
jgi:hypothetical protein